MNKKSLILSLEIVWWIVTAIVAYFVISPILQNFSSFKFLWLNIFYIAIVVTYTRHIFLLKHSYLANAPYRFKVGMIFFSIPLIAFVVQMLWGFQDYMDGGGRAEIFDFLKTAISTSEQEELYDYIYTEMYFFGIGSIIVGLVLPLRMVLSIWRGMNRGTV